MSARSWCAALLLLGAVDLAAINLAVGPQLVPEIPLVAAVEEIAARRPLAIAAPAPEPTPSIEQRPAPAAAPVIEPPIAEPSPEPAAEPLEVAAAEPEPEPEPAPRAPPSPLPTVGSDPPEKAAIIYFATNRATLWPAAQARLDEIAATLGANPTWGLMVAGHADARGTDDHNEHLSERRVRRVREYLATRGIAEERVRGRAFGERQPVADDGDSTALHRNRRVEITFTRRDP